MFKIKSDNGFTVIEILLVIAIIGVMAGLSAPYLGSFLARNELRNESLKIVDSLRRARNQTMAGVEDKIWGVHFESGKYVVFAGSSYSAADPLNDAVDLPAVLTFSVINFTGGGNDVVFSQPYGETLNYGTTTIQNDSGDSRTIVINQAGMAQEQ